MKKSLLLAVALVVGLAFVANAADSTTTTKVTGDTTKTVVKSSEGKLVETIVDKPGVTTTNTKITGPDGKMTENVVEKKNSTVTNTEIQGKDLDLKRTVTETPGKIAGSTQVNVKNGAIKNLNIDWTYNRTADNRYVLEYTVNEHDNKKMAKELGLTPGEAAAITTGKHKITSTNPYTAIDMSDDFRALIAKDLKESINKNKK